MTKAIVIHEHGGPEVLRWEDIDVGDPGPGEVRIRHHAAGLNYRDTYHREGTYRVPGLPQIIGGDGAGVIEAVGAGVEGLKTGQRVAYANGPMGSYCEVRLMPADYVVVLPDEITAEMASAMMVKGQTAHFLLRQSYPVKAGDTILVHAAAGGVGLIMCQWAKHLGATVIGTVGSDEKADLARANGCDHAIVYSRENFAERVREITNGAGLPVVFDGVGKDTFAGSLDCLGPNGTLVAYGNASGNFPALDPMVLMSKGSLFFTRVSGNSYIANRRDLEIASGELFALVEAGKIKIKISRAFDLKEAAQAHRDLEARKTVGSVIFRI